MIEDLKLFITEELVPQYDLQDLDENQSLLETGILDSLGLLKLMAFVENKYHITVDDDELVPENFETLATLAAFISRKR